MPPPPPSLKYPVCRPRCSSTKCSPRMFHVPATGQAAGIQCEQNHVIAALRELTVFEERNRNTVAILCKWGSCGKGVPL